MFLKKVKDKFKVVPVHTIKTHKGTRNTVLSFLTLAQNGCQIINFLSSGCSEEYLDQKLKKEQESKQNCMINNCIICIPSYLLLEY